jgi:hypothetical protein
LGAVVAFGSSGGSFGSSGGLLVAVVAMGYSLYFNRTFAYGIYYCGIYFNEIYFYSSILLQTVYTSP